MSPIIITYSAKPLTEDQPERFDCFLEDGTKISPPRGFKFLAMDSARELLKRGYSPDLPMTAKVKGSSSWSWKPQPIAAFASVTVRETNTRSAPLRTFEAYPGPHLRSFVQGEAKQAV